MLRRVPVAVVLLLTSTSCTVTKDPVTINYTGLSYSVALPKDDNQETQASIDTASVAIVPSISASAASAPGGCPEFKLPFLGRIPILTQEEINKTRGDDRARQRQLIEHIETLHRFTVAEQKRIRDAARNQRAACSK